MRITFLGDAMMQPEQLPLYGHDGEYDFAECFVALKEFLKNTDYAVANLETPIAAAEHGGFTNKLYEFNTPLSYALALKDAGVALVSTANNHCLDRGLPGLFSTVANLDRAGLEHVGTRAAPGDSFIIKELGGVKIGFLAFTYGTNAFANHCFLREDEYQFVDMLQNQELSSPFDRALRESAAWPWRLARALCRPLHLGQLDVAPFERREKNGRRLARYREQLQKCRASGAELIVALLHVGGQYNPAPSAYTREMCDFSFAHGADVVVANHEHVIHGWEARAGRFCEFSLGNLVSVNGVTVEPFDKMAEYSMALHLDVAPGKRQFAFSLFHSVLRDDGKIVCVPVYDEWQAANAERKDKIAKEVAVILRRLYGEGAPACPIQPEYPIDLA